MLKVVFVSAVLMLGSGAPAVTSYPYASRCPEAGINERVDRWAMYMCNCTSYVAWALESRGQRTDWFEPGEMDARNWPLIARREGISVGSTPRAGAVAVWPHLSRFGHVAYVTRVDAKGFFDVAEYNFPSGKAETFAFDVRRGLSRGGVTFVYVPMRRRG
jgi:surface antigen